MTDWMATTNIASTALTSMTLQYPDFSTDDAAIALMNFVETAVNVSYLNIEYQEMTRPVGIFFKPQTDDSNGKAIVTVYEALTEDVIRSLDSLRT